MRGYCIPFSMKDKYERIPEDDPGHRYKVKRQKIPFSEVKKAVSEIREKREKERQQKNQQANERYLK